MSEVPSARRAELQAILDTKRDAHPELARPLTLASLRKVLAREQVRIEIKAHPRPAQLLPLPKGWTIVIDEATSASERLVLACHELAHYWLHVDIDEVVTYDYSPPWYDALRESEANYLAEQMIADPVQQRPITPKVSRRRQRPQVAVPDFLAEEDRDGDRIRVAANDAQRAYASEMPPPIQHTPHVPTIRFPLRKSEWQSLDFYRATIAIGEPYPHNMVIYSTPNVEYITATIPTARAIVEQLAKAGHKRTAVWVRRRIRESSSSTTL